MHRSKKVKSCDQVLTFIFEGLYLNHHFNKTKRVIMGALAKRHLNGALLAGP